MGLFSKILTKLGLKKSEPAPVSSTEEKKSAQQTTQAKWPEPTKQGLQNRPPVRAMSTPPVGRPSSTPAAAPTPTPAPMEMVDVVSKLDQMAEGSGLKWRVSIVDLLKVLGLDSSKSARKELAQELGCPPDQMKDPELRDMNMWLHKTVLAKIAENGGNIPQDLLD